MSLNIHVRLVGAGVNAPEPELLQTPTNVTQMVVGAGSWQEQARAYLRWVRAERREAWRVQCRAVGRLWRMADNGGGRLVWFAG